MKKHLNILLVSLVAVSLIACSNSKNKSSSSSESSTTSDPTPEDFDVNTIIGQVGYALNKYNSQVTVKYMKDNSSLEGKTTVAIKDLLNIMHKALDGKMEEIKGARGYQGDFEISEASRDLTTQEAEDLYFFKQYGLISGIYDPDEILDMAGVRQILQRVHSYQGSSLNDDFAATIMRDWLYDNDTFDGRQASESFSASTVVDSSKMYINSLKLYEDAVKTTDYSSLANVYQYYVNPYDIYSTSSAYYIDFNKIKSDYTSYSGLQSVEKYFIENYGQCSFANSYELDGYIVDENTWKFAYCISPDTNNIFRNIYNNYYGDASSYWESEGSNILSIIESNISALSGVSGENIASNFHSFLTEFFSIFNNDIVPNYQTYLQSKGNLIKDGVDPFYLATDDSSIKMSDYSTATYSITNFNLPDYDYLFEMAIGKMIKKAKTDSTILSYFKSYAYVTTYFREFQGTLSLLDDDAKLPVNNLLDTFGYSLTSYYQTTSQYTYAKERSIGVFEQIIKTLKSNATTNGWLSTEGVEALTAKANMVRHSMFAEFEGEDYDYAKYFKYTYDNDLSQALMQKSKAKMQMINDWNANRVDLSYAVSLLMEPFTCNAFYQSLANSITITMGYLGSISFDLSNISDEEFLATFGLVVGHEITHGFDSNGCYYDGHGQRVSSSIFPAEDLETYKAKQAQVVELYNYEVMPGFEQSGTITLSEDLADIGGFSIAQTMGSEIEGFDFAEFYKQTARHFMAKSSRSLYTSKYAPNVHAFGLGRANPLFLNSPRFMQTFNIKPGDGMYRDPSSSIVVW